MLDFEDHETERQVRRLARCWVDSARKLIARGCEPADVMAALTVCVMQVADDQDLSDFGAELLSTAVQAALEAAEPGPVGHA